MYQIRTLSHILHEDTKFLNKYFKASNHLTHFSTNAFVWFIWAGSPLQLLHSTFELNDSFSKFFQERMVKGFHQQLRLLLGVNFGC